MGPIREDFAGQRQLKFRVKRETLHLFKAKGESTYQVYLKVLAYAFYGSQYDLTIDPRIDCKYQPHVASIDLTGGVRFWAHCGPIAMDHLAYVLKHSHADEVVLVEEHQAGEEDPDFTELDFTDRVARLRRHLHYRYTDGKLRILSFRALDEWLDPEDVEINPYNYHLIRF